MNIFDFEDYKVYSLQRVKSTPGGGRGEFLRMAEHLGVHSTLISHVFKGHKDLSSEQAAGVADYFGLVPLEAEYFVTLVQWQRAGTLGLKSILHRQLVEMRKRGGEVVNRLPRDRVLTDAEKAMFYSSWIFSGSRLLSAIDGFNSIDSIAQHFGVEKSLVSEVVHFLVETGLCKYEGSLLRPGPSRTHLEGSSMLVHRHHTNWRLKAIERFQNIDSKSELVFTSPVALSKQDALKIRGKILQFIQESDKIFDPSPSEALYCLNIDWIEVK